MSTKASQTRFRYRNRQIIVPEEHLAVGVIVNVHGLNGEVKVELHTDFPERFQAGAELLLGEDLTPVTIQRARPHKGQILLLLAGVRERAAAEALRGQWLFVHESDAQELEQDTYWIHDLIGLTVCDESGETLGRLDDVLVTGANDVYVIKPVVELGVRELLLPAIAEVVLAVDIERGIMTVAVPPGLLD